MKAHIKIHPIAKAFLARAGAKGGQATTEAKRKASAQNAAKARAAKQANE